METILHTIMNKRKKQLEIEKRELKQPSLVEAIHKNGLQIIGEIKRASPSKGQISTENFDMTKQLATYVEKKIAAFSILTENQFFKGKNEDILEARHLYPNMPILRKDFIFDPFQIMHAKLLGASAILLIVTMLSDTQLMTLHELALQLELDVLVEIHNEEDLARAIKIKDIALIGINNRDLHTFKTSLTTTQNLYDKIRKQIDIAIISESGLHTKEDLMFVEQLGIDGVLVGEALMRGEL